MASKMSVKKIKPMPKPTPLLKQTASLYSAIIMAMPTMKEPIKGMKIRKTSQPGIPTIWKKR